MRGRVDVRVVDAQGVLLHQIVGDVTDVDKARKHAGRFGFAPLAGHVDVRVCDERGALLHQVAAPILDVDAAKRHARRMPLEDGHQEYDRAAAVAAAAAASEASKVLKVLEAPARRRKGR